MRLLLWSDLQAHFANIAECRIALQELLHTADTVKPDVIINAGDMKDEYSPISQSVIKECVRQTREIVAAGYRYIVLKGNHDRESQSPDASDWLSVIKAAGAEIVTKPRTLMANTRLAFLPFIADKVQLVEAAAKLAQTDSSVLIFHAEVLGSTPGKSGISLEDLQADKYLACFGGHIHNHQQIGQNVWYIGSPFTHDWGEANYTKGHLVVNFGGVRGETAYVDVEQRITKIPHWYDVDFLEKHDITPEPGAYIRSKLTVANKKISDQLLKEERRIKAKYGEGVFVHTVPMLEKVSTDELVLKGASDKDKAAQYVAVTMPEAARFEARRTVAYMASKLDRVKESRTTKSLRFELARAKRVLVFDKLRVPLENLGLVLIKGINRDWPKRSNGTGKTSLLSCIAPIPLFGETLKKQKTDAWASERVEGTAESYLRVRDHSGRKIEIMRTRRPHSLRLMIDGVGKSSGLRGTGHKAGDTQGRIERVTGYDLRTLTNAVYIDQSIANGFVFGTQSMRMDLVNRFQNLDRFEEALKMVDEDIKRNKENSSGIEFAIEASEVSLEELETALKLKQQVQMETQWETKLHEIRAELSQQIDAHAAAAVSKQVYDEMQQDVDDLTADRRALEIKVRTANNDVAVAQAEVARGRRLIQLGRCSTCGQVATEVGKEIVAAASVRQKEAAQVRDDLLKSSTKLNERFDKQSAKIAYYERMMDRLEDEIIVLREREQQLDQAVSQEAERNRKLADERKVLETQLSMTKRVLRAQLSALKNRAIDREMLEYVKKAFHRSGMPIYLSTALCPLLNSAAEDYSEVFTDGKLKVRFRVENGEFQVDVINPYGSETVEGQSVGESAMAGIIAAFALREAAPKTNLLVLDEPGHGLDQEGARQFAYGLQKLKDRFESILLVTHSPAIESVLAGEHLWCVEKRDGKSSLSVVR